MKYLTYSVIIALNTQILKELEGYPSKFQKVDGKNILEEIIKKAKSQPNQYSAAAFYLSEISIKHVFNSANKRTAYLAAHMFLQLNGITLNLTKEEAIQLSKDVRNGKYSLDQLTQYLTQNSTTK